MEKLEILKRTAQNVGCEVIENEQMSRHTTFQIGGPADLFITVSNIIALKDVIKAAGALGIPLLPLGNGSNLLVSDDGIRGAVLNLNGDFRKISLADPVTINCGAGATLASLCNFARKNSLSGLEFAWGIPGSAGGAAFMDAGAYDGQLSDVLFSTTHVTRSGRTGFLMGEEMKLGYRSSAYQTNGCLITSLVVRLKKGNQDQISMQMEELLKRRKAKQPVELPSAGSAFKRPEGHFAGTLIEQCGLKGTRVGGAMVSEKHAGFIVNMGGATCTDVLSLIEEIQKTVLQQTGISLECEVRYLS